MRPEQEDPPRHILEELFGSITVFQLSVKTLDIITVLRILENLSTLSKCLSPATCALVYACSSVLCAALETSVAAVIQELPGSQCPTKEHY